MYFFSDFHPSLVWCDYNFIADQNPMNKNINFLQLQLRGEKQIWSTSCKPHFPLESYNIVKEPIHTSLLTLAATRWETTAHFLEIKNILERKEIDRFNSQTVILVAIQRENMSPFFSVSTLTLGIDLQLASSQTSKESRLQYGRCWGFFCCCYFLFLLLLLQCDTNRQNYLGETCTWFCSFCPLNYQAGFVLLALIVPCHVGFYCTIKAVFCFDLRVCVYFPSSLPLRGSV